MDFYTELFVERLKGIKEYIIECEYNLSSARDKLISLYTDEISRLSKENIALKQINAAYEAEYQAKQRGGN